LERLSRMVTKEKKTIHLRYYALLREERGLSQETIQTTAQTVQELYGQLRKKHHFKLSTNLLRLAINNEFKGWATKIKSNDEIIFIPPVAGG
jgi:molybdopterin converting factor small subunit